MVHQIFSGLMLAAALSGPPLLDLTGCEAADVEARSDGQVLVIVWRCPDGQAWAVRYQATGVRPALHVKPAPSPAPKGTP